jgi:hypothetical protein
MCADDYDFAASAKLAETREIFVSKVTLKADKFSQSDPGAPEEFNILRAVNAGKFGASRRFYASVELFAKCRLGRPRYSTEVRRADFALVAPSSRGQTAGSKRWVVNRFACGQILAAAAVWSGQRAG